MTSLRNRLGSLPRPSFLSVEVVLAIGPVLALIVGTAVLQPLLIDPSRTDSALGPAILVGGLGVGSALGLVAILLAHAVVDAVGLAREWPPDAAFTPRRAGHAAVRAAETVGAVAFLVIVVASVDVLSGDLPSPAGVGVMLLLGGGYLAVAGVVVAHGIGRLALGALES